MLNLIESSVFAEVSSTESSQLLLQKFLFTFHAQLSPSSKRKGTRKNAKQKPMIVQKTETNKIAMSIY